MDVHEPLPPTPGSQFANSAPESTPSKAPGPPQQAAPESCGYFIIRQTLVQQEHKNRGNAGGFKASDELDAPHVHVPSGSYQGINARTRIDLV